MIPGSLLASLPQKLRIGSLVECWGDCLENLSAVRADPQHSGPTCRSSDGETQVQDVAAAKNGIGGVTDEPIQNAKFEELGERRCALSNGAASREGAHHLEISPSLQEGGSSSSLKTRCKGSSLTGKVIPDVDWMLQVSSLNVFDPRGSASGNEFLYKHLAAKSELPSVCRGGRSAQAKPGVCKYWVNEGRCARGVDCPYEHPPHGEPLKKARAGYLAAKASGNHALGNAGKAKRAQVFGDWVKETYERGNPDLRVVDVAAGAHGELAFHLAEHGIFCTSVEPRERKLTKAQRKALAEKGVRLPKESTPPALPQSLVGAHRRELFADDKFWTDVVRKEADILVGLHPDQVTEAIVDVALRAGVPFAVVPCCVFPKLFPDRRIGDGRPVITYEDFVEYLQRKGKAHGKVVEKATLKFAGSNTVLFTRT
ncbi:hypothetical protein KFL_000110350 [Klebsormidium nitens]|uniref:C3H1-type domain-containing protein n=1 Tax=Klebsormidium nitens TaxID=105231 RepID=A0A1Y1HR90_KLENI|nr:hypothetical protein KFL_000110350 [Klebsormidium nitens]|eukprot:GAQ78338.1 hypothetical protein KFL_000110350 [Klebsormidium nitens]